MIGFVISVHEFEDPQILSSSNYADPHKTDNGMLNSYFMNKQLTAESSECTPTAHR